MDKTVIKDLARFLINAEVEKKRGAQANERASRFDR